MNRKVIFVSQSPNLRNPTHQSDSPSQVQVLKMTNKDVELESLEYNLIIYAVWSCFLCTPPRPLSSDGAAATVSKQTARWQENKQANNKH